MTTPISHIPLSLWKQVSERLHTDNIQKVVVGAVIILDGQVLLIERATTDFMGGLVEIPSGTLDTNEDLSDALVREVQEETSLVISQINAYLGSFDYLSASGKKARQLNFLVTTQSGSVKLNPAEHSNYFLLPRQSPEFAKLNISAECRGILNAAFNL